MKKKTIEKLVSLSSVLTGLLIYLLAKSCHLNRTKVDSHNHLKGYHRLKRLNMKELNQYPEGSTGLPPATQKPLLRSSMITLLPCCISRLPSFQAIKSAKTATNEYVNITIIPNQAVRGAFLNNLIILIVKVSFSFTIEISERGE